MILKSKVSKNNPDAKHKSEKTNLVLSETCEKCENKCERGIRYLKNIHDGKSGNGVVCYK